MTSHWAGIRRLFRLDRGRADVERGVAEELDFHFNQAVESLMARGLAAEAARAEAERRFGDVRGTRERLLQIDRERVGRDARTEWWSNFRQDVHYAVRGLRLRPAFAAAVVVTLGLGIGANATMFGIVDRVMLRPPAMLHNPGDVNRVYLGRTFDGVLRYTSNFQYTRYLELVRDTHAFSATAAFAADQLAVGTGTDTKEERIGIASASFWSFFDMRPALGRFFTTADDQIPNGTTVAVLSYGYWQRVMGGRTDVLGQVMHIGHLQYTIVGVAPNGFAGVEIQPVIAWIPITAYAGQELEQGGGAILTQNGKTPPTRYYTSYNWSWMEMLVRRKPDVSATTASADLTNAFRQSYLAEGKLRRSQPPIGQVKPHALATPIQRERGPLAAPEAKVSVWLIGVSLIVLLIACANVGNLLLARALQRRREVAVRLALGISRRRLLAQMVTEGVILSSLGGVAALAIAQWGGGVLRATLLPDVEWPSTLADQRVLLFTAGVALIAGLLASLAPIVQSRNTNLVEALKSGSREGTRQRSSLRSGLLLLQGALSVLLLVGAGLFVRSFHNVRTMRLGYDMEQLLMVQHQSRGEKLTPEAETALKRGMLETARAFPGVSQAARNMTMPFWNTQSEDLYVAGVDSVNKLGEFDLQAVSPGYFATTGTRILAGRPITEEDRHGGLPVMVVSQSMARTLWPKQPALGKCVKLGSDTAPCRQVVGVAEDIKAGSLQDDPSLLYYLAIDQFQEQAGGLFVRTHGLADAHSAEALRRGLQPLMPGESYVTVRPFSAILGQETRSWELGATMFTIFGVLALLVAVVGLYSVMAFNVTQRTHEMGVRVALGAGAQDILGLVMREALLLTSIAVVTGTAAALLAGRWLKPLLFQTSPRDPMILIGVAVTLLVVSALASAAPAWRAARVDPNLALRSD